MALQPVFNMQYRHSSLAGYTETGSDAGLRVSGMEMDAFSVGMGARFQSLVGESVVNRSAFLEARAMVSADMSDRSGLARVGFSNGGGVSAEVESAKVGAVSLELGAGVNVPISQKTSIFFDTSAELRSGYTNLNATVGFKLNF